MTTDHTPLSQHIYSVSGLTRDIKTLLEVKFPLVRVEGEISNYRKSPVGHHYFTLKDDFSQIHCVLFKSTYVKKSIQLSDGIKVLASGAISVYEPRGSYQLIITRVEEKGIGELQLAFEKMKRRLYEEGLFDEDRKKPIPPFPQRIGIVTSPGGAAIRDILHVLKRRFSNIHIILNPTRVQGTAAAAEIAAAIAEFNDMRNVDVIIIGRGGGSIEDLWPFNEEIVARAIYRSRLPVISAVGHEIDWTISDFVADLRAPTPSAAAEIVISAKDRFAEKIENLHNRLLAAATGILADLKARLKLAVGSYVFRELISMVHQYQQLVDEYTHRMITNIKHTASAASDKVAALTRHLHAIDPKAVLSRGYSITFKHEGVVLKDASTLKTGEKVRTMLNKGEFKSTVESIT